MFETIKKRFNLQKSSSQTNKTLSDWLIQSQNRNGFLREEALKNIASISDEAVFDMLLERQNDYVPEVRLIAFEEIRKWFQPAKLSFLLPRANQILHLSHHCRSKHQVIHQDFIEVLIDDNGLDTVLTYLKKHQGKAVRAIYQFLVLSGHFSGRLYIYRQNGLPRKQK